MPSPTDLPSFSQLEQLPAPAIADVEARYERLLSDLGRARDGAQTLDVILQWEALKRQTLSWESVARTRFTLDTRDAERRAERERCERLSTQWRTHDLAIMRGLVSSPQRTQLSERIGPYIFERWECELASFSPEIAEQVIQEQALGADYQALVGGAQVEFDGQPLTLSQLKRHETSSDRATRQRAAEARWQWAADHGAQLDTLYDDLVKLRHQMARTLGYDSYIPLAYKLLGRTDYGQTDVAAWRQQIRSQVVPIASAIQQRRARRLGLTSLMAWDEGIYDDQPNPAPQGDAAWMTAKAQQMFDELEPKLGQLYRLMVEHGYMDLESRSGKASGGYCTSFLNVKMPYIFANFNGTAGDSNVFTHEMGHAYQSWLSLHHATLDQLASPTYDAAEIHSMSLELLCWPWMHLFFGDQAQRFRQMHLEDDLLFLPYGACVDHFQHEVFSAPEMTPAARRALWFKMEGEYTPWRDWGHLPHASSGGRWQLQLHLYQAPFYYIDYTLAGACALQMWALDTRDHDDAMRRYNTLCERGGDAPFRALVEGAGLRSPFEPGSLDDALTDAKTFLSLMT